MTQPHPPGWYPDPQRREIQRYWDGEKWTDQSRSSKPRMPKSNRIAVAVLAVAAVIAIIVGSVVAGGDDEDPTAASTPQATAIDPTSPDRVLIVAEKLCADLMRKQWVDPDADFDNWEITAENPAGSSPPSWRVFGQMGTGSTPRGFYCDIEWQAAADNYHATLVG